MGRSGLVVPLVFVAFLLDSCGGPESGGIGEGFAIYLLEDSATSLEDVSQEDLENLILAEEPMITVRDVTSYVWGEHSFSVTPEALRRLESAGCRPFVVTVDRQKVYLGAFHSLYSSLSPGGVPHIMVTPAGLDLRLLAPLPGAVDLRDDERIRRSLEGAGVLEGP